MRLSAALALAAAPALAGEDAFWEYGDWRVSVTHVDGEEHAYTECRASTGGDGLPTLSVVVGLIDGEMREPPHVEVVEHAMRGAPTAMVDGASTGFRFDDGALFRGVIHTGESEDGPLYRVGRAILTPDHAPEALRAMRRGRLVHVGISPKWTQAFSLSGFTASFGKLAEQCRFDPGDVID